MATVEGDRVGAILSADADKVLFLGYGVYEGEQIPPGVDYDEVLAGSVKAVREVLVKTAELSLEEAMKMEAGFRALLMKMKSETVFDEGVEETAGKLIESAKKLAAMDDEGVKEYIRERGFLDRTIKNPRIKLDNGDVVWGFQCWWGTEEEIKRQLARSEEMGIRVEEIRIGDVEVSIREVRR